MPAIKKPKEVANIPYKDKGDLLFLFRLAIKYQEFEKNKIFQTTFHQEACARVNYIHLSIKQMYNIDDIVRAQICPRNLPGVRNSTSFSHRDDKHWVRDPEKRGISICGDVKHTRS